MGSVDSESSGVEKKTGYPKSIFFIISNEFCERFSYYGMKAILVLYFKNVFLFSDNASTEYYHLFSMACYFTPVLGAILADSLLGKFRTIFYVSILYALGNIILSYASYATNQIMTWLALAAIALGTGGIKPCVSAFGGDQFGPGQEAQLQKFFSFFYISINAGGLLSTFITPILREDVDCFGRADCFPLAFGVPAILMVIALAIFVLGNILTKYVMVPPSKENIVVTTGKCVCVSVWRKIKGICSSRAKRDHWLDYADDKCDRKTLNEIKAVMRVLTLYLPLPIFWALFDQQGSRWTLQANNMEGNFFGIYRLKPDQIQVINPVLIIFMIPLFEFAIYPLFAKLNFLKKPLQRMTTGGVLAAVSFIICGFFQLKLESDLPPELSPNSAHFAIVNGLNTTIHFPHTSLQSEPFSLSPYEKIVYPNKPINDWKNNPILNIHITGNSVGDCKSGQNYTVSAYSTVKDGVILFITESLCTDKRIQIYNFPHMLEKPEEGGSNVGLVYNIKNYEISNQNFYFKNSAFQTKLSSINTTIQHLSGGSTGAADYKELEVHKGGDYSLEIMNTNSSNTVIPEKFEFKQGGSYLIIIYGDDKNLNSRTHELVNANSVSMFWQVIQYAVVTCAEIMFSITGLEFSYSQAPTSMKSVLQAAWLLTVAFGNLLIVIIASSKIFDKQSYEFFFFAGLMLLDMILFAIMAYFYVPLESIEVEDSVEHENNANKNGKVNGNAHQNGSTNGRTGINNKAFSDDNTSF